MSFCVHVAIYKDIIYAKIKNLERQCTSARFCLYTFLLKRIGGFRPIKKLTCPTILYRATSTKDMNGSELPHNLISVPISTRPNEYSTDFNSLAGDACEHFSQVLTHVKHISISIGLVNKLHIHVPLGICTGYPLIFVDCLKGVLV